MKSQTNSKIGTHAHNKKQHVHEQINKWFIGGRIWNALKY